MRTTESVIAHVQTERNMQRERYSSEHDAMVSSTDWDDLIRSYLGPPGNASRYVRLVQVAAIAIAAAEQEPDPFHNAALASQSEEKEP